MLKPRPRFEDLPLREGDPPWSAWGLYGPEDELGTLNLLTSETVVNASQEIRTGHRVGLDLPIDYLTAPSHGRKSLSHNVIWKAPRAVHDDELAFNTQVRHQTIKTVDIFLKPPPMSRFQPNGMDCATSDMLARVFGIMGFPNPRYRVTTERGHPF
jgi:hypothetical protein